MQSYNNKRNTIRGHEFDFSEREMWIEEEILLERLERREKILNKKRMRRIDKEEETTNG